MSGINAFVLDAKHERERHAGFVDLVRTETDWHISQLSFADSQADPVGFYPKVIGALEEADIIICFGDYFWFRFCGHTGGEFQKVIEKKLQVGVPFYLQLIRAQENRPPQGLLDFFKRLEIIPTKYRVFSDTDAYEAHQSGSACWFRKSDGCFLNPEILKGIDKIALSTSNVIDYMGDVYPVVTISPMHFLVDERDLPVGRRLAERGAVAVERRTEKECALIVSGALASDPAETLGGMLPGIEENRKVVQQIVAHLSASISSAGNRSLIAFRDFSKLERRLGQLIQTEVGEVCWGSEYLSSISRQSEGEHHDGGGPRLFIGHL